MKQLHHATVRLNSFTLCLDSKFAVRALHPTPCPDLMHGSLEKYGGV
jgi:hypothetical protein